MSKKLVLMSDSHTRTDFEVPDGDVLIHAGDATFSGNYAEVWEFAKWYGQFPHAKKIFCAGNHDWGFERQPEIFESMIKDNGIIYLRDSAVEIEGIKIYGSPYSPEFMGWAFPVNRYDGEAQRKWSQIPDDTQVLITHGPPKGVLDLTVGYQEMTPSGIGRYSPPEHVGCWDLRERVKNLKALKLHVFGHIHHSYGKEVIDRVVYCNASVCNEQYRAVNPLIVIDL